MKAGIHFDVSPADYFADPCPAPSLTQSLAKILLEKSPLHAWYAHPRLNPDFQRDDDTKFDVGTVAHKILIGRGKEIAVLDYPDWRTKAAQEARKTAAEKGTLAVLGKNMARADKMARAAREQLEARALGHLFEQGAGEVVMVWQEGDIWCRQMIDWLTDDRCTFADYKTTGFSVAPHALSRLMVQAGWPIQAAMADRGLYALDPENKGRRRYLFIAQEDEVPYALSVAQLTEASMTMGHKMLANAMETWGECLRENVFPGYPLDIVRPEYPGWAETEWLDREQEEDVRKHSDLIMAG